MILSDEEYNEMWEWGREFIDKHCIWRGTETHPKMPGKKEGTWITWEFHLKNGLLNAEFSSVISQLLLHKIGKEYKSYEFQIAGMESAALPLLTSIPLIAKVHDIDINAISIKKHRNFYGLPNYIEGRVNEKPVLLIDDICHTTKTLCDGMNTLVGQGCKYILDRPFVIVNNIKIDEEDFVANRNDYLPNGVSIVGIYSITDFTIPKDYKEKEEEFA